MSILTDAIRAEIAELARSTPRDVEDDPGAALSILAADAGTLLDLRDTIEGGLMADEVTRLEGLALIAKLFEIATELRDERHL